MEPVILGVTDFVAILNQTFELAYPNLIIQGELANFRVSKGRWLYFDLKDQTSSVKFFGTVHHLPGPLEDGMMLQVRGNPRLHHLYGFSVNVVSLRPVGEGSLRQAAALLEAKLRGEGLFATERKRPLPFPPQTVGLITSGQSAAYADFMKILGSRWPGVRVSLADVQVQGEPAVDQIVAALTHFNGLAEPPDVLVLTRGGGSADDLAAFSNELVTRAVAASRIPTLVAIGHEIDISLAELAADQRASTPSNAAELLVPDSQQVKLQLDVSQAQLGQLLSAQVSGAQHRLAMIRAQLVELLATRLATAHQDVQLKRQLLEAFNPQRLLRQGYALVYTGSKLVRSSRDLKIGQDINLRLTDGSIAAQITGKAVQ
ncbi:MAG: exodeoxyribonuclease VII large subunit [Candidatus Saccharimonadales bacterium]